MALPQRVASNGQISFTGGPPLNTGFVQNITGSPLDAATAKTLSGISTQSAVSRGMGAGQKGARRSRRSRDSSKLHRFKKRGGGLAAKIPTLPEAHTISGVSFAGNHLNNVNNLNQIRADKVYDSLIDATPVQMGAARAGFRIRDEEEMYGSGKDTKRQRDGRSRKRTHRRQHRKHTATRRRSRRHL